jgi:hypothetical protein
MFLCVVLLLSFVLLKVKTYPHSMPLFCAWKYRIKSMVHLKDSWVGSISLEKSL